MRFRNDPNCELCQEPYKQVFTTQPLRFLWWLDDQFHRRHADENWFARWLCRFVDAYLWPEDLPRPAGYRKVSAETVTAVVPEKETP